MLRQRQRAPIRQGGVISLLLFNQKLNNENNHLICKMKNESLNR